MPTWHYIGFMSSRSRGILMAASSIMYLGQKIKLPTYCPRSVHLGRPFLPAYHSSIFGSRQSSHHLSPSQYLSRLIRNLMSSQWTWMTAAVRESRGLHGRSRGLLGQTRGLRSQCRSSSWRSTNPSSLFVLCHLGHSQ